MSDNINNDLVPNAPQGEFVLFQRGDGQAQVECRFEADTLWLTQKMIADLYQKKVNTINEHLTSIYQYDELEQNSTIRKFRIVQQEGKRQVSRDIEHYNLEAILAVGYRVRSKQGVQFLQWATATLKEYLVKGFVMDDERLKKPESSQYFDELLNRLVTSYLEFAELQAKRGKLMKMADWSSKLNDFLKLSDFDILTHAGKISAEQAKQKAKVEYNKYRNIIDMQPTQVDKDLADALQRLEKNQIIQRFT
ncbi:MAG: virulence RhuM family protein [Colwellia sp.]|nr:virulence RhuM family protein [Colwellia sp.]